MLKNIKIIVLDFIKNYIAALFASSVYKKNKLFFYTLIFGLITLFNYNNRTIYILFLLLYIFLAKKFASGISALILCYFISLPYQVGKTYFIELIPSFLLSRTEYPNGLFTTVVLSSNFFFGLIATLMLLFILIRQFFLKLQYHISRHLLLLIFIISVFLSSLFSEYPLLSLYFASGYLFPIVIFLLYLKLSNQEQISLGKNLWQAFLGISIFMTIIAFGQFILKHSLGLSIESVHWEQRFTGADEGLIIYRVRSLLSHANEFGMFLIIPILRLFPELFQKSRNKIVIVFRIGLFCLFIVGLLLSYSRSAWISVGITLFFGAYYIEKLKELRLPMYMSKLIKTIFVLLLPVLLFIFLPRVIESFNTFDISGSGYTRWLLIQEYLAFIASHKFFGSGTGLSVWAILYENPVGVLSYFASPAHVVYLQLAAEIGIIGIFALLIYLIRSLFRMISLQRTLSLSNLGVILGFSGLLVNGIFQPVYGIFFPLLFLSLIIYQNEIRN